jgi:hypothetical protein
MTAATILFLEMNAIKWAITTRSSWNLIHRLKKNMLGSKFGKAGMIDRFQDGRRRHVGTSML